MNYTGYCDDNPRREGCDSFYLTLEASYIPTVSGSISAVSSLLILIIACRSLSHLGSVYHRIMVGMSFFDLISSLAIAFTTTAMPSNVIYPFEGRRVYGNTATCEAQGFFFIFGGVGVFLMISGLSIFYASLIQFRISDKNLRRYLEPAIHIFAWTGALGSSITFLSLDMYNPSLWDPWCTITSYPYKCLNDDCIRGGKLSPLGLKVLQYTFLIILSTGVLNIVTCMCIIIYGSWMQNEYFYPNAATTPSSIVRERQPQQEEDNSRSQSASSQPPQLRTTNEVEGNNADAMEMGPSLTSSSVTEEGINNTTLSPPPPTNHNPPSSVRTSPTWLSMRKELVRQALMYVGAFILTWFFAVVGLMVRSNLVDTLYIAIYPLQGFFNASIFIYHKVHNMRSANPSIGLHDTLYTLFIDPTPENTNAAQISGLSIINTTLRWRRQGFNNFMTQNVRESVEDASKDVNLSFEEEISQEVSHMFGLISFASSSKDKNRKEQDKDDVDSFFQHPNSANDRSSAQGSSNFQHDNNVSIKSGEESRVGNNSGLSLNDDSTVKATARMPQE